MAWCSKWMFFEIGDTYSIKVSFWHRSEIRVPPPPILKTLFLCILVIWTVMLRDILLIYLIDVLKPGRCWCGDFQNGYPRDTHGFSKLNSSKLDDLEVTLPWHTHTHGISISTTILPELCDSGWHSFRTFWVRSDQKDRTPRKNNNLSQKWIDITYHAKLSGSSNRFIFFHWGLNPWLCRRRRGCCMAPGCEVMQHDISNQRKRKEHI